MPLVWLPTLALLVASPEPATRDASRSGPTQVKIPTRISQALPTAAERQALELGLRPRADGGYEYKGAEGERFDATIHRDGTVEFHLEPTVQIKLDGVCLIAICVTRGMSRKSSRTRREHAKVVTVTTVTQLAAGLVAGLVGVPLLAGATIPAAHAARPPPPAATGIPGSGVLANPQVPNALMGTISGRYGHLPQPTTAMTAFVDRTFDLRLDLAKAAEVERLARALDQLPLSLLEAWSAQDTVQARHDLVLETWDSLALAPETHHRDRMLAASADLTLDARRAAATAEARRIILAFVRERAPLGSRHAFTRAELRRFNEDRDPSTRFDPYDVEAAPPKP